MLSGFEIPWAGAVGQCGWSRYNKNSFDAVLSMGPFYHLPDPADRERAADELLRVLQPGGLAFGAFLTRYSFLQRTTAIPDERRQLRGSYRLTPVWPPAGAMSDSTNSWMPRERWEALVRGEDCPLCEGVAAAERTNDVGYLIAPMRISHLWLFACQFPAGSCVLICTKHVRERYAPDRFRGGV